MPSEPADTLPKGTKIERPLGCDQGEFSGQLFRKVGMSPHLYGAVNEGYRTDRGPRFQRCRDSSSNNCGQFTTCPG